MATPRTGRPRGRPKGTKNKRTIERQSVLAEGVAAAVDTLSSEQIDRLTPLDVMRLAMLTAVRAKDFVTAVAVAKELAPYEHAKKAPIVQNDDPESILKIEGGLPD